jgi:hypothetical protein
METRVTDDVDKPYGNAFVITDDGVGSELDEDGRVWVYQYLSTGLASTNGMGQEALWEFVDVAADPTNEDRDVALVVKCRLSDVLNWHIENNSSDGLLSPESKPLLSAMRKELAEMVARIDATEYWPE